MPQDYHIQYIQDLDQKGIQHGLVPAARGEGYAQLQQEEAILQAAKDQEDRVYQEAIEQAQQRMGALGHLAYTPKYVEIVDIAIQAHEEDVPIDVLDIIKRFEVDIVNGVPVEDSDVAQDTRLYLHRQLDVWSKSNNPGFWESPVTTTAAESKGNLDRVRRLIALNPASQLLGGVAPIRNITKTPLTRPRSPGPSRPQYWIKRNTKSDDIPVVLNAHELPANDPEIVDPFLIQRDPFMEHPNPTAESQLASIPFFRRWNRAEMYPSDRGCAVEDPEGNFCGRQTRQGCEDTQHFGEGTPICSECEETSRQKFAAIFCELASLGRPLRAVSELRGRFDYSCRVIAKSGRPER
ncbi:hypothetical protein F5Y04DRAFT_246145 [Hypomontagnella monticulosa]|nr:hypothetical protein F5Y04DRAFT_246145 [Hypomontagnella monticulosa]